MKTGVWKGIAAGEGNSVSICFDIPDRGADSNLTGSCRVDVRDTASRDIREVRTPNMQQEMQGWAAGRMEGSMGDASRTKGTDRVAYFAAEVVSRLVKGDAPAAPVLNEALVERLMKAVVSFDPSAFAEMRPDFRRAKITPSMLADLYIPEVARRLGADWALDCATFAEVTMGTARLQSILREIGQEWVADAAEAGNGPTLLLVLPEGEQHSLGAMVLASRLRRSGISVSLRVGESAPVLASFVRERGFGAALISIACHERLESCIKLVKTLKEATGGSLKIAVGGAVLENPEYTVAETGADVVTNDIELALRKLGLLEPTVPVND